jgi:hypothetical protein
MRFLCCAVHALAVQLTHFTVQFTASAGPALCTSLQGAARVVVHIILNHHSAENNHQAVQRQRHGSFSRHHVLALPN